MTTAFAPSTVSISGSTLSSKTACSARLPFGNALLKFTPKHPHRRCWRLEANTQHCASRICQLLRGGANSGVIRMVLHFAHQNHRCFFSVFRQRALFRIRRQVFRRPAHSSGCAARQKRHKQFFFTAGQYAQGHTVFGSAAQRTVGAAVLCASSTDHQYGIVVVKIQCFDPTIAPPSKAV